MTNKIRLMDALTTYTGEQDSLAAFIAVATEEIGENWVSRIYDELPDLVPELKEKLDHAYHYYGATMAWGEVQEYLTQTEPLNISDIEDRIPTLEYWLNFFGENGTVIITQLREKLKTIAASETKSQPDISLTAPTQEETPSVIDSNEETANTDVPNTNISENDTVDILHESDV